MSEWFNIKDLNEFVYSTRRIVFNSFASKNEDDDLFEEIKEEEQEEFDKVLSQEEALVIVKSIAKKQSNKKTKEIRYLISEDDFQKIVEELNSRMVSNILHGMVNKGILDTAFDSEAQDFVFWIKEENK